MSDVINSAEMKSINSLVNTEDRVMLDLYIDMLIDGVYSPINSLCARTGVSKSSMGRFLAQPLHKQYVTEKLDYWLNCADVDRFTILENLRTVANAKITDFVDIIDGHVRFKNSDSIPQEAWRAVKKVKINAYGSPEIELHSPQQAQLLLAKLQKMLSTDINIKTEVEHKDRLFDLPKANSPQKMGEVVDIASSTTSVFDECRDLSDDIKQTARQLLRATSDQHREDYSPSANVAKAKSFIDWNDPTNFYYEEDDD